MRFPTSAVFRTALGALALAILLAPLSAFAGQPPSATGAGFFADQSRVFAFSAVRHLDGSVTGEGVLIRPGIVFFHFRANCLSVVGNQATITGVITRNTWTSDPSLDFTGNNFWFRVVDNGEGKKATGPDQMTFFFFDDVPPPCTNVETADMCVPASCTASTTGTGVDGASLMPINSGNIQVRTGF